MHSAEQKAREYFTRNAAFYTTSPAHTDSAVLERIVELAEPQAHHRVLDIATGGGHTAFALAPSVARVVATDLTWTMVRSARELAQQKQIQNTAFLLQDAHYLPFDDHSFDLITCRRACHHFSNLPEALAEMHRVLRPGGRLVIDDRSVPADAYTDRMMNRLDLLHDPSHIRQYSPDEWQKLLVSIGFSVHTIETYTRDRPLTSLTQGATVQDAAEIVRLLQATTPEEAAKLGYGEVDGVPHIRHWYLTILAKK
jgi:ubiquinone/menaquinone biosynthesis C-methylase UbiE